MNEAGFGVRGRVLDDATRTPLSGIRVVVHDPATALHDVTMVATTDADGTFEIAIPATLAKRMFAGAPDISTARSPAQLFFFNGATKIDTKTVDLTMGDLALGAFPEPFCIRQGGHRALAFSVQGRVLDAAVLRRIVLAPQDAHAATDEVVAKLAALRIESAMLPGEGSTPSSRDLLDSSGLPEPKVRAFVEASVGYRGTPDAFFAELRSNPALEAQDVDTLEFTAKGAALLGNFLPALTQLQASRRRGEIRRLDDVAAWGRPSWRGRATHWPTPKPPRRSMPRR